MKSIKINITILFIGLLILAFVNMEKDNGELTRQNPSNDSLLMADIASVKSTKNLTVFYLSGDILLNQAEYITLSEALEKDYVTLFETGSVNELAVTNKSKQYLFIHAGDIVKGGKQDRTMGSDIIVPPNEKDMPLASFCVEASRWSQRGDEKSDKFSVNENMLPSRNLKMAAQQAQDQSMIWSTITAQQEKLNENVSRMKGMNVDVRSEQSLTSLQLTLENKDLDSLRKVYSEQFISLPARENGIIGFAYAINGELYGADVYNNGALFQDMWPKLLNSIVVEAIAEFENDTIEYQAPDSIVFELNRVYQGNKTTRELNAITRLVSYDTKTLMVHETFDLAHNGCIHKSYIIKDTTQVSNYYEMDFERQDYRNNINPMQEPDNIQNITPEQQIQPRPQTQEQK